jgi:ABC-2 type transport system permease protein
MSKTLIIARRELLNLVGRASFWISLILVPLIVAVIVLIVALGSGVAFFAAERARAEESPLQAVVDQHGLLRNQPGVLAKNTALKLVETEDAARALMADKTINGYFVIAPDFMTSGAVRQVVNELNPLDVRERSASFRETLRLALLNGDDALLTRYTEPIDIRSEVSLAPAGARGTAGDSPLPIVASLMLMGVIFGSAMYLLQSVTTEKENRIIEVLISSVTSKELLLGKVLGMGAVGLLQFMITLVSLLTALPVLQRVPAIEPFLRAITPQAIIWMVIFLVLGYFAYAALLAGLGAIIPTEKQAQSLTFFVLLPLLVPIYVNTAITGNPDGPLALALSLFPLSAPTAMSMRMFSGDVPVWQLVLCAALMLGAAWLALTLAARLFQAQMLLRGARPTLREVLAAAR